MSPFLLLDDSHCVLDIIGIGSKEGISVSGAADGVSPEGIVGRVIGASEIKGEIIDAPLGILKRYLLFLDDLTGEDVAFYIRTVINLQECQLIHAAHLAVADPCRDKVVAGL